MRNKQSPRQVRPADIAREMTTCFDMDEGLDWHKRRSDRDFS